MAIQYLFIDWSTYTITIRNLASTLLTHNPSVQEIVAISRGGLTFGHLLSDFLRVPVWTITIQSYTDIQTQGEVKIKDGLQTSIQNKHILLVDDVSDSGKTFTRAIEYIQELHPKKITTMAMFYKPHSRYRPDYFAKTTTKWIIFPYEHTEMILLITKNMQKQGKTKREIQTYLETLQFDPKHIAFARKYHV
ncbi:MAG: phosphoribosyltransferase family protein [Patescibacteria group bacterium]|nr:phosphoribosyltransferase family protein [Patescibacteria group bacterium]